MLGMLKIRIQNKLSSLLDRLIDVILTLNDILGKIYHLLDVWISFRHLAVVDCIYFNLYFCREEEKRRN